jgi:hypothetical protein
MARCPYCGRDIQNKSEFDFHVKTCGFGHRPDGYEKQKKLGGEF